MKSVLVTGGAGFIGSALVGALLSRGDHVLVLDDLSRVGSTDRLAALEALEAPGLRVEVADIVDAKEVDRIIGTHGPFKGVFHLASQVAVTWAIEDPRHDFMVNALGSFNVIDALRRLSPESRCIYMSSNKVYGAMEGLAVTEDGEHLALVGLPEGVGVNHKVEARTPYGVSKAAGESYFLDAAMTFGMETAALRASCIYGPGQSRQEGQGWVAWFAQAIEAGHSLRIYGDGKTTRDLLVVDDLVDLYLRVLDGPATEGLVLNVGGGRKNARSLLEVVGFLEGLFGRPAQLSMEPERPGDQRVFITDTSLARELYGWEPRLSPEQGMERFLRGS